MAGSFRGTTIGLLTAVALATGCAKEPATSDSSTPSQPSTPPAVVALSIEGSPAPVGERAQFVATAVLPNGTSQTVTTLATWQSSNQAVATVSMAGLVSSVTAGTVDISATYSGIRGVRSVTVMPRPVVSLSGRVVDAVSGGVLPNITVAIMDGANEGRATTTDGSGQYSFSGLLGGSFTVSASAAGYVVQSRQTTANADVRLDFTLQRTTSTGACPPLTFGALTVNLAAVKTVTECGFVITASQADWISFANFGNPAPSMVFSASNATTGEIRVTAGGRSFHFRSADLYSSTTPIPHVIVGSRNSVTQFTVEGTVPNTFGRFATVTNSQAGALIDTLSIRITNPVSSTCCSNPVGVDNISVTF